MNAAESTDLQAIQKEIQPLKDQYESRIEALEVRLKQAETVSEEAKSKAQKATEAANQPAPQEAARSNAFNPDISLVLQGTYANLTRNPDDNALTGFQTGEEIGPGSQGFGLFESELNLYASIDPYFYGGLTAALAPDGRIGIEEAFAQTLGLPYGLTVKVGRFFSHLGYINDNVNSSTLDMQAAGMHVQ